MPDPHRWNRRQLVIGAVVAIAAGCRPSRDATPSSPPRAPTPPQPAPTTTTTSVRPGATVAPTAPSPTTKSSDVPTAPAPGQPAVFVDHGPRTGTAVALTYHASGSPDLAGALLDVLQDHRVRVTVFAVGSWLDANPTLGRRIVDDGHELANHTLTHQPMGSLTPTQLHTEIAGGARALRPFIGPATTWFRPSGIKVPTAAILAEAGLAGYPYSVGYDVDTLDFQDPGADAVLANFNADLQPGSIVSMHFGHQGTIEATPRLLAALDARGLRHVTVGELLA
jgi:peptidoglycan/xylan/chitin deacetylase (PgdA/CDA1 family)